VPDGAVVIIGGTSGIGRALAERYAGQGRKVVVAGRDVTRADGVARALGATAEGLAVDLAQPEAIAGALSGVRDVAHLVLTAIDRDENRAREYDLAGALRLVTMKLVGYTEAIHALLPELRADASILLFGGLAKDRPYAGSTTVSTVNGGIAALVRTLATELAPIRVNALHPGIVGDSPAWVAKPPAVLEAVVARTPLGRLVTMAEVADAAAFLLENGAVNGVDLAVDGGWLLQ
jgi:NAD(P)-dependent dehydrogenase (short-subunit alcohol dehydrogenase family)